MDGVVALLGVSHHTAALRLLERAALSERAARRLLDELAVDARVREAVALSTCNRTELYAVAATAADADAALREALQRHSDVGAAGLACSAYSLADGAAVEHLFRVAAGLDSAVLGECEIVGQLRAAVQRAESAGMVGPVLGGAFRHALMAGRRVRSHTRIARGSTSLAVLVGRAAVARRAERPVLVIGAGALARSVCGVLAGLGAPLMVANRTAQAAERLAEAHGAVVVPWAQLEGALAEAGAAICATAAPGPVLTAARLQAAVAGRTGELTLFDLAVPRDVEPAAAGVDGVVLHDLEELQHRLEANRGARGADAERARALVAEEVDRFFAWQQEQAVAPAVHAAWRRAERIRRAELARYGDLDPEERERLDRVTSALVRRLLEDPTRRLRASATAGGPHLEVFRELFATDERATGERPALRIVS